jgi:O-antigen/teichoic acid export membrane protein
MTESWVPAEHGEDNRNLRRRTARGATWALVDAWGRQLTQLVVFIFLARLLQPADFGLVALAMVFVILASLFVDQGLGDAIVQRRELTPLHIDTAFWAALALGVTLTIAGVGLAIPIATLLGEPDLQPVLQALSLIFTLTAFNAIPMGILRRELRFRSLALRTLFSIIGGGVAGIAMAYLGYGVWALVGQQLVTAVLSVVALWAASPWRPSMRFSRRHFRELFGFGAHIVGGDLLLYVQRYSDNLLIGTVLGTIALGVYAVGYRIMDAGNHVLIGLARKVAFPTLSRLQAEPERLKRAYIRMARVTGTALVPVYVGLALTAPELIELVFGQRWREAGPVAAVLFLVGPASALQGFGGSLFNAVGRPDINVKLRLVSTLVAVTGFVLAVSFGVLAVAAAFTARAYVMMPVQLYLQRRYAGIPTSEFLRRLRGPGVATLLMAAAVLATKWLLLPRVDFVLLLLAEVAVGALVYVAAILVIERALLAEVVEFVAQAMPGGERAQRRLERTLARRRGSAS